MARSFGDADFGSTLAGARSNWGWFIVIGIILIALGIYALGNLFAATVASIFVVGTMMMVGGIAQILLSLRGRTWHYFLIWLLSGILYLVAGGFVLADPIMASVVLTLIFAFVLMAAGLARIWVGWMARPANGWGWLAAAGVITLAVGILVAIQWPLSGLWVIGMVLAADLLFQGWSYIAFGLALRANP